jgi:hypothetical protein
MRQRWTYFNLVRVLYASLLFQSLLLAAALMAVREDLNNRLNLFRFLQTHGGDEFGTLHPEFIHRPGISDSHFNGCKTIVFWFEAPSPSRLRLILRKSTFSRSSFSFSGRLTLRLGCSQGSWKRFFGPRSAGSARQGQRASYGWRTFKDLPSLVRAFATCRGKLKNVVTFLFC